MSDKAFIEKFGLYSTITAAGLTVLVGSPALSLLAGAASVFQYQNYKKTLK